MVIFTIGYEGLNVGTFVSLLAQHGIERVVDVRELPLSRKPGFSKTALAHELDRSGIAYLHMGELGCPKPVRNRYRDDSDWKRYTEGFLKYINTQDVAVAELCELVAESSCALLCFEADFEHCHRSMVAAAVNGKCGAVVRHLTLEDLQTAPPVRRSLAVA